MSRKEIATRDDIALLVHVFYEKIRADLEIGPVFEAVITDWEAHLGKLVDFWESSLFGVRKYYGNPIKEHVGVDKTMGFALSPSYFGLWLNLWFETLDTYFEGAHVDLLKERARKMGTVLMVHIFEERKLSNPL